MIVILDAKFTVGTVTSAPFNIDIAHFTIAHVGTAINLASSRLGG
jgi:hypothetical protein